MIKLVNRETVQELHRQSSLFVTDQKDNHQLLLVVNLAEALHVLPSILRLVKEVAVVKLVPVLIEVMIVEARDIEALVRIIALPDTAKEVAAEI